MGGGVCQSSIRTDPMYFLYVRRFRNLLCRNAFRLLFFPIYLRFFCEFISLPQPQNNNNKKLSLSVRPILVLRTFLCLKIVRSSPNLVCLFFRPFPTMLFSTTFLVVGLFELMVRFR